MLIQTKIEGQDIQSLGFGDTSNTYTVSFYVKSNVTGTYILEQLGGTASATGHQISTPYTVNNVNTWERKTITLNVDSGAMTSDNTSGLTLSFWLGTGSSYSSGTLSTSWSSSGAANRAVGQVNLASATNNYWQITGLQLEVGDTATPFEHSRSYGEELAKCQRYYYRDNIASNDHALSTQANWNTTHFFGPYYMPVTMRANPTGSYSALSNFTLYQNSQTRTLTSLSFGASTSLNSRELTSHVSSSITPQGGAGWLRGQGTGWIALDAEL
jgi:hypothetical protein